MPDISEIERIANDPTLPRRRRLFLIQQLLSAPGNAAYRAVGAALARAVYDPEKERERKARARARDPEHFRELVRIRSARRKDKKAAWRKDNPEKMRRYQDTYKARHPEKAREQSRRAWERLFADEEKHRAWLEAMAKKRREKGEARRDYRPCPSRMRHAWERYCERYAPGGQGKEAEEAFAIESAREARETLYSQNKR